MSSNFKIKAICEYCRNDFIAKTTTTKYKFSSRAYKARKREQKIQACSDQRGNHKIEHGIAH
ncbi:hypothetical protein QE441_000111 [Chryseobacterium sp. SORGH_AS909]|uniref:Uncharacterized protein n=1 Tax=Chryseobacterium camelliae TaxID=1265445 RepID=A0ABU0TIQ7_9FLAO|nr:hypothetical protein [Chryseobacterium camelliae]MDQ1100875.1 hypothetical protein [Chryseobacterium sp. SORGH_AS_1048]MDR6084317.1 hypothetical protein [Chryseobacterium sp. SORGH_AS_0909]MDR6132588.1 hypothetical protein [Chryseobacterium sp. SORGH_AS_1175]MDT3409206.1 hypothetical protein [Pseudacidovorax intermedius]